MQVSAILLVLVSAHDSCSTYVQLTYHKWNHSIGEGVKHVCFLERSMLARLHLTGCVHLPDQSCLRMELMYSLSCRCTDDETFTSGWQYHCSCGDLHIYSCTSAGSCGTDSALEVQRKEKELAQSTYMCIPYICAT